MDVVVAQSVNGALLLLMLIALLTIGSRLHSSAMGLTLVAVFCVFPGSAECITQPSVMLTAVLLAWSVAFALLPGVAGLLSLFVAVMAGIAWPWAWIFVPVLLMYFLRRGWHALGGVVGLLGGAAACVAGVTWLTQPTVPRADGALAAAALQPAHTATLMEDGSIVVARREAEGPEQADAMKSWAWKWAVERDDATLNSMHGTPTSQRILPPNGAAPDDVMYRTVAADGEAWSALLPGYRAALAERPLTARAVAAVRTVAESTWLAQQPPALPVKGPWELWAGSEPTTIERWTFSRRMVKFAAVLIALVVSALLFFGGRRREHQLIGGLLALGSVVLFASPTGAVANLAWFLPLVLAAPAAHAGAPPKGNKSGGGGGGSVLSEIDLGPEPRISVEK
jgi:hypothetical protein